MGCCSSRPPQRPNPDGGFGFGQSRELRATLPAGAASGDKSPPPSIDLTTLAGATEVDVVAYAELFRAGFAQLAKNHVH